MERKAFYLFAASIIVGLFSKTPALAVFGWALAFFVPVFFLISVESAGLFQTFIAAAASLLVLYFAAGWQIALSLAEMFVVGGVLKLALDNFHKAGAVVLSLTGCYFGLFILEDLFLGVPKQLLSSPAATVIPYRWGIYFFFSCFSAVITFIGVIVAKKQNFGFEELKFGLLPVLFFVAGGILSLMKFYKPLSILGLNIALGAAGFFIIQGMSIFLFLLKNLSTGWKIVLLILVVITPPAFVLATTAVGLFDLWIDFRKRFNRRAS